jgi:tRNA(His) 5'-end guanylyltransferase
MSDTSKDSLGDRMKGFENIEAGRRLEASLPIVARLDGRGFSSFTRGLQRPYDTRLQRLMQTVTKHMVEETNAVLGYTQSDEISLVILTAPESQPYFGGRVQKLCSTLAAVCSVQFNKFLEKELPEKRELLPTFDARVWNVPTLWEAANTILWRELDASKNSIQMSARTMFSHKFLQDLTGRQMVEKMKNEKGIDWRDYPTDFKHGSFFFRATVERAFTTEELVNLPEKHQARQNPSLLVQRSQIQKREFPPLNTIANLPEALFFGAEVVSKVVGQNTSPS